MSSVNKALAHKDKIKWMKSWCKTQKLNLSLQGECGFGRPCVGVMARDIYPDYVWHDEKYNRIDPNGEVWVPKDAYHKHPCVAVLGWGEDAESQLYDWLRWFDSNGFSLTVKELSSAGMSDIDKALGMHLEVRMVKAK